MFKEYFFWFAQPPSILNNYDIWTGYAFAGMAVASLLIWAAAKFGVSHEIVKKYLYRWRSIFLSMGLIGLLWFGFRYENTQIFSKRFWAGLIIVIFLGWFAYLLKLMFVNFRQEFAEYENNKLKSKYLPKRKV